MLLRQRRNIRQTLVVLAFLAILTFTLKLQHMIFNLNQDQHLPFHTEHAWISTNLIGDIPRDTLRVGKQKAATNYGERLNPKEGKLFAMLGIKLVELSLYDSDNTTYDVDFEGPEVDKTAGFVNSEHSKKTNISVHHYDSHSLRGNSQEKSTPLNPRISSRKTGSSRKTYSGHKLKELVNEKVLHSTDTRTEINQKLNGDVALTDLTTSAQVDGTFPDLYLAIIIVSRPENMLYRLATRKTWARNAKELDTVLRFIVGYDPNWDSLVEEEMRLHHDLLILEEDDVYDLLPTKVLEGFTWALHQKAQPRYVMKIDDDSIVNLPYLLNELHNGVINSTQILGAICKDAPVVRDPSDKWSVSILDYPLDRYPVYAAGGGYVMSAQAASDILQVRSRTIGWIHLEDVYITGVLAAKAGLSHVAHSGFSYWSDEKAKPCDFLLNRRVVSVGHTDADINKMFAKTISLIQTGGAEVCARLERSSPLSII